MPYSRAQLKRLLDPDLINAAQMPILAARVAETVVRRQVFRTEDAAVSAQYALYRRAYTAIRDTAVRAGERYDLTKVEPTRTGRQWQDAVMATVQAASGALADAVAAEGLRRAVAARLGGYYGRLWLLDSATRDDVPIRIPYADLYRLALDTADVLREDVYDDLIRQLLGREWCELYANELDLLVPQIKLAISNGMSAGESIPDIMRRVRGVMGVETDRRRGFRANFNRVQTLTRTVVNTASNTGAADAYAANADILSGMEWLAARDERACSQCSALNGTVYKLGDTTRPPAHPNCRCALAPVVDPALLLPRATPPRATLNEWAAQQGVMAALQLFLSPRGDTQRVA